MLSLAAVGKTHLRHLKDQVFPDAAQLALGKTKMTAITPLSVTKNMLINVTGAMLWRLGGMYLSARTYRENELTIWVEARPPGSILRSCTA
jgi:hypothetical protein